MKKRILLVFVFGVIIVAVVILYLVINFKSEEEEIKPTPEVLEFINRYKEQIDFDHPYVRCIFNKTCNGTFQLGMGASLGENETEIRNFLSKYGEVKRIYAFDYYSISFDTDNLYKISPILNSSMFSNVVLYSVRSDYKITRDEELRYCEVDDDCVAVTEGCCGCSAGGGNTVINKKYLDNWSSYQRLACSGTGCLAVISNHWTCLWLKTEKCIENTCQFANYTEVPCEVPMYSSCKNDIPKSDWEKENDYGQISDGIVSCSKVISLCEEDKNLIEILELCKNKTTIPENYSRGILVAYLDPNATNAEINDFIGLSGLDVERKLTDYWYEIRGDFNLHEVNLSLEEKEEFVKNDTDNFVIYLGSFTSKVKQVAHSSYRVHHEPNMAFGTYDNYIIIYVYGNVSLEESENLIKSYVGYNETIYSVKVHNAIPIGIITVPEGEEVGWICKLREEDVLYNVGFS